MNLLAVSFCFLIIRELFKTQTLFCFSISFCGVHAIECPTSSMIIVQCQSTPIPPTWACPGDCQPVDRLPLWLCRSLGTKPLFFSSYPDQFISYVMFWLFFHRQIEEEDVSISCWTFTLCSSHTSMRAAFIFYSCFFDLPSSGWVVMLAQEWHLSLLKIFVILSYFCRERVCFEWFYCWPSLQ